MQVPDGGNRPVNKTSGIRSDIPLERFDTGQRPPEPVRVRVGTARTKGSSAPTPPKNGKGKKRGRSETEEGEGNAWVHREEEADRNTTRGKG